MYRTYNLLFAPCRRRVLIQIVTERFQEIIGLFAPLQQAMDNLEASYTIEERAIIQDYMHKSEQILFAETQKLKEHAE